MSERRMSGRILRVESDILCGQITAPHRGLTVGYAQVNANANISALQIVSQTLEISVLRLSTGEYTQVPKRHTHMVRTDVRFLMTFANRHSQAAPIGVCTVDCGLDQGRIHNSFGNALGLLGIARGGHGDFNELRRPFPITGDLFGEIGTDLIEGGLEGMQINLPSQAVRHDNGGIAGTGIGVYTDHVEWGIPPTPQHWTECGRRDGSICQEETQHRGHVGLDHGGAFSDASEHRIADPCRDALWMGVSGHDRLRCQSELVWTQLPPEANRERLPEFFQRQLLTNDSCRTGNDVFRSDIQ